jgi:hypothetical protein
LDVYGYLKSRKIFIPRIIFTIALFIPNIIPVLFKVDPNVLFCVFQMRLLLSIYFVLNSYIKTFTYLKLFSVYLLYLSISINTWTVLSDFLQNIQLIILIISIIIFIIGILILITIIYKIHRKEMSLVIRFIDLELEYIQSIFHISIFLLLIISNYITFIYFFIIKNPSESSMYLYLLISGYIFNIYIIIISHIGNFLFQKDFKRFLIKEVVIILL